MKKVNLGDVFISVISILFVIGSIFIFDTCPAKADGSFMVCHWANKIATVIGIVIFALSIENLFVENKIKIGLNSSFIALSIFLALVPGFLINLCKMHNMRCWNIFRPAVLVFAILLFVISVLNFILLIKKEKKNDK